MEMGWFKKSDNVIDLGERYRKQQEKLKEIREESQGLKTQENIPTTTGIGIFGMSSTTTTTPVQEEGIVDLSAGADEKRRRLAKRLMDMTDKIEELSNQIYHLQQRLEVLEKKDGGTSNTSGLGMFN